MAKLLCNQIFTFAVPCDSVLRYMVENSANKRIAEIGAGMNGEERGERERGERGEKREKRGQKREEKANSCLQEVDTGRTC